MRDQKHIGNKEKLIIKMYQIQFSKIFQDMNGKYLNALTIKQHYANTACRKPININEKPPKFKMNQLPFNTM